MCVSHSLCGTVTTQCSRNGSLVSPLTRSAWGQQRSNQGQTKVKHRRDTISNFFLINNFTQIYTIDFFQLCCMLRFMLVVCCMLVVLCLFKA